MLNEQQAQPEPMMTKLLDTKMKPLATKLLKHLLWSYNETLTVPLNSHKTGTNSLWISASVLHKIRYKLLYLITKNYFFNMYDTSCVPSTENLDTTQLHHIYWPWICEHLKSYCTLTADNLTQFPVQHNLASLGQLTSIKHPVSAQVNKYAIH